MGKKCVRWAKEEINYLKDNYVKWKVSVNDIVAGLRNMYGADRTPQVIRRKAHKLGLKRPTTPINHDYFKTWSSNMAYILGLHAADGNVYKDKKWNNSKRWIIGLKNDDLETKDINDDGGNIQVLQFVLKELESEHTIYKVSQKDKQTGKTYYSYRIDICSNNICNDLIKLGFGPRKSLNMGFPKDMPLHLYSDFLRGVFDGDGCFIIREKWDSSCRPKSCYIDSGDKNFLKRLKKDFINIGDIKQSNSTKIERIEEENQKLRKQHKKMKRIPAPSWRWSINKQEFQMKLGEYIYYEGHGFHMDRKYNKWLIIKKYIESKELETV